MLVAIADDFSGASDQAGMLARAGVASLLVLDERFPVGPEWEAVTYATRLRALPVAEAQRESRRLFALAQSLQPQMIQYKYCSTFDSTPEGNIGPILDVTLEALRAPGTVVMPALPINGRTTYLGYHFVHGVPLNESPMRDHPLNPMTDANLVRWLQQQTRRRVGLLPYYLIEQGEAAIQQRLDELWCEEQPYVVVDCLDQRYVQAVAEAVTDLAFISGSSALPMELPGVWRQQRLLGPQHSEQPLARRPSRAPVLAMAGSCAQQTGVQVEVAQDSEIPVLRINVRRLFKVDPLEMARKLLPKVKQAFDNSSEVLLAATEDPLHRMLTLDAAQQAGLSPRKLGLRIERLLGEVARLAREELSLRHFICAGGETSGAVCQALQLQAVEIVREIDPGVPLCRALPDRDVVIALKGGNFGRDDFFSHAAALARRVRLDD